MVRAATTHRRLTIVTAVVLIVADQVTKSLAADRLGDRPGGVHVVGTVWLQLTYNPGAAFGLGSGVTPIVEAVVVVLVVGLLVIGRRRSRRAGLLEALGLGLVVGGALGNLADRLVRGNGGAVIDFFDVARVGTHSYWPVFNLADAGIVVGAVILGLTRARVKEPAETETPAHGPRS